MDKKMMNAWLQAQAQKQELTTTKMQQKRLGINLSENLGLGAAGMVAGQMAGQMANKAVQEEAGYNLNEQLSTEEEAYAKSHKSMMASMIKQYGKEKGTRVFYASVRNAVKKKKD